MKWNEAEMVALVGRRAADWEGKLTYRPPKGGGTFAKQQGYKERYFKLIGNLLFCLRINSHGKGDENDPVCVLLMENFTVNPDPMQELQSFTVTFRSEEEEKKHNFVTDSARSVSQWVEALRESSYTQRREKLILLQIKLRNKTGVDPLLGTNLENNPVYSPATTSLPSSPDHIGNLLGPPQPVPRTKAKTKAKGFTSYMGVEEDTSLRHSVERCEELFAQAAIGKEKPSFKSHVPTANLLDLDS